MEIEREIAKELSKEIEDIHITILIGARQVGKTFLLRKIRDEAENKGLRIGFFDLEQPHVLGELNKTDEEVFDLLVNSFDVVFIDEFHYIKNISHILKAIYDSGKRIKIFASGSSSMEIHKHIKESLAGRKITYKIYPCSFNEIGQVIKDDPLNYYFVYGGLPGLVNLVDDEKRKMLLNDILQSYLLKDIKSLIKEENIRAFNNLLYLLAQYQGSIVVTASLAREIGLTPKSIENYLEKLSQTYVNFPLHSFSTNFGNELKKSKKYYLYDLGIRNTILKNFANLNSREDAGHMVESFVFLELNRHVSPETEIRFWRLKDGTEVDFIWIKNQKYYPIEVKTSCKIGDAPKGLKSFMNRYPKTEKAFVLCKDQEGESNYNGVPVIYRKWDFASNIPSAV